eukprot:4330508-Alexandrium_andersonii.AAC.1
MPTPFRRRAPARPRRAGPKPDAEAPSAPQSHQLCEANNPRRRAPRAAHAGGCACSSGACSSRDAPGTERSGE